MSGTTGAVQPRRGGGGGAAGGARRGGRSTVKTQLAATSAAAAQPDDTEQVRNLRAKYADQLSMLRELFANWTDEDLLFALQDAGGEVETAVGRISEGHAEQFSSVKSKKQAKKDALSSTTPVSFHGGAVSQNGTATVVQSARGGRGGAMAARGGRGGAATRGARGGARGGTRGTSRGDADSIAPATSTATAPATASTGPTWADAVAATSSSKQNGVSAGWDDDADDLGEKGSQMAAVPDTVGVSSAPIATQKQTTRTDDAGHSGTEKKEHGAIVSALQRVGSKLVPKSSKMSWAQVARPADPPMANPAPAVTPQVATIQPAAQRAVETEQSRGATDDQAIADTDVAQSSVPPAAAPSEVEGPAPTAVLVVEPIQPDAEAQTSSHHGPPGLDSAALSVSSPEDGPSTFNTAQRPPAFRAGQSQRALQRARQDVPVVMPGGSAQVDTLGKRFGGLSFLGGDQADVDVPSADHTPAGAAALPVLAGLPQNASRQTSSSQTAFAGPTHQDAFAQATPPQSIGNKDAYASHQYGYQHGLQQHQQAHQAAVAQAQVQHQAAVPQQHQAQQVQSSQTEQSSQYQAYGGAPGQNPQHDASHQAQQTAPTSGQVAAQQPYGDYSSMYGGLDAQRLSGYYGNYDAGTGTRAGDDRSGAVASQTPQHQLASSNSTEGSNGTSVQTGLPQHQQQQQQFQNMMPYYYPHYYLPNQFQQYAQPAANYGQYALYGGQPQHPSKPTTPAASLQSPYAQQPHSEAAAGGVPYGTSGLASNVGQYGQSPAATSNVGASAYGDYGRPNIASNTSSTSQQQQQQQQQHASADYSKYYGNSGASNTTSTIPGLSGFLGQASVGVSSNGEAGAGTPGKATSSSLDNSYRQYDSSKLGPGQGQRQGSGAASHSGVQGQQPQQGQAAAQQTTVPNGQAQLPQQHQHQQQHQTQLPHHQQQQQHYYQQYGAYAGQQPSGATGNYGSYPYQQRQYWGQ